MKITDGMSSFTTDQLEIMTPKVQLAHKLQISEVTIQVYDKLAFGNIMDYRTAYPKIDNIRIRSMPLTKYQCWVIAKLMVETIKLRLKVVRHLLKSNKDYLSTFTYTEFCKIENNKRID
jgi:hypothetical protein